MDSIIAKKIQKEVQNQQKGKNDEITFPSECCKSCFKNLKLGESDDKRWYEYVSMIKIWLPAFKTDFLKYFFLMEILLWYVR